MPRGSPSRGRAWTAAAGTAVAAALWFAGGADLVWRLVAGPPDLGAVAFETLVRRTTANDALACPPGLCAASSDFPPPRLAMPAAELRRAFAAAIAAEPRLERVAADDAALTDRWVQRTRLMRFPDTIVARFVDLPDGRATLALYSRSQLGRDDFGVNRDRIARWLGRLEEAVASRDRPAAGTRPSATPPAAATGSR
ncbi:DUF1499 domain-containing protein [Stella sp.]|uniref:DUF1499 domain-containing protein n=1 Tax=Stella sp. TaxID=2912054 RepID=UPI0035AEE8B0